MWKNKKSLASRATSGFMALLLTAISTISPFSTVPTYATGNWADLSYRQVEKDDVEIYIQSESENFAPGANISLELYIQNNTDDTLTGGTLSLRDKKEVFGESANFVFDESGDMENSPKINEKGNVANITIAPGEVFELTMEGIVNEDLELANRRSISFFLAANTDTENPVSKLVEYNFTTGIATFLPIEFANGNEFEAEEEGSMTFRISMDQTDYFFEIMDDYEIATDSDSIATDSNTDIASDSDADEFISNLKGIDYVLKNYGVEFENVKLTDVQAIQTFDGSFEVEATVGFNIAADAEPGRHFGVAEATVKVGKKNYEISQAFEYTVVETEQKLTEEQMAQVQNVIDLIAKLPSWEEHAAKVDAFDSEEDYEGLEKYLIEIKKITMKAYNAYELLSDEQKALISEEDYLWMFDLYGMLSNVIIQDDASIIMDELNGDYAFISSLVLQQDSFVTGTAPFDGDDSAGNDSKGANSILRTFDTATYTVEFSTGLRDEVKAQNISGYKTGRVFFEIILPKSADEAVFEKGAMLWLNSAPDIYVEQVTETVGNKTLQVLRGSYRLIASDADNAAIGASINEFSIAIRALRMLNGDTIQPEVTLWLEHNDVGVSLKDGVIPQNIVSTKYAESSEKHECSTEGHGCEYKELSLPQITISAAPRFNVVLESSTSTQNTVVGKYNMNSTNPAALNRDLGEVEGRLSAAGILIEVRGKDGHGLKGVEFPSEKKPITFTLSLSSYFKRANGTTDASKSAKYPLLFFSGGGNSSVNSDNADKREVDAYKNYVLTIPFNRGRNHHACENGGTWSFSEVAGDRSKVEVTVSGFKFDTSHFPYGYSDGTDKNYKYYNPNTINNWWEIGEAVFSAGEVWVLQPYYSLDGNNYVVNEFNSEGQFHYKLTISDFEMWDESGDKVTTQANPTNKNDDQCEFTQALKNPGSADGLISYLKYNYKQWDDALTEGSIDKDNDWAVAGQQIAIRAHTVFTGGTEQYAAVAVDQLVKFDDEFFEPEKYSIGNINYFKAEGRQTKIYWAAKPNGKGWVDDEEMKKATIDDLVFYDSLDKLKADGKIPIGLLDERRGVQAEGSHNTMIFILGKIKEDCPTNKVYMTVRNSYVWRKTAIWEAAANYFNTNKQALSDAQYCQYMKEVFPSQANSEKPLMMDDNGIFNKKYPVPSWRHDYHFTNGRGQKLSENEYVEIEDTGGCKTAAKATYDADGWHAGTGVRYYQDSCLVVPYESSISKESAQTERDPDSGVEVSKKVYDMNQGQRTIDYVLEPKIDRKLGEGSSSAGQLSTVVYVEDTLPKDLTYINGSAYLGGTYDEKSTGIKVTGGINEDANADTSATMYFKQEEFKKNADGTTTVRWSFPVTLDTNTPNWTAPIYFSCSIGTPGDEATDVKNSDEVNNTVKIWSDGEAKRAFSLSNGNMAQYGITVQKTGAYSIAKLSDQLVVDAWADMGFTMNIGNNSDKPVTNMIIVESLPYNGIGESSFHGKLQLTEFSAGATDNDSHSDSLLSGFTFYYTTNSEYKGCTGSSLKSVNFATNNDWKQLKLSATSNNVAGRPYGIFTTSDGKAFPGSVTDQIIAIVAVGKLPESDTLKMHVSVKLPDGEANDTLLNKLYVGALESEARTRVVSRNLEGLVWYDTNLDGEQNEAPDKNMSGVKVSLWKLDNKGVYQPYCYPGTTKQVVVETGYEISAQATGDSAKTVYKPDGEEGHYRFTELPAGTYAVRFDYGTNKLDNYVASPANRIFNDEKDSDGISKKNGTDLYTEVTGIEMKAAKEITQGTGEVKNVDSGFGKVGSVTIKKLVEGNLGDWDKDFDFTIFVNDGTYKDYTVTSGDGVTITEGSFKLSHNETVIVGNIPVDATVVITEVNGDYVASIKVNNEAKPDEDDTSETCAKITLNGFTDGTTIVFTNTKDAIVDTGILLDSAPYILTLAIVFGGIAIFVINKRKKEDDLD